MQFFLKIDEVSGSFYAIACFFTNNKLINCNGLIGSLRKVQKYYTF